MTKHIVVIDDDYMNREIMEAFLGLEQYRVSSAHNGTTGLDLVAKEIPDLVILDVRMPDMNGYEVCKRLRSAEQTRSIPILMVTGFDDPADRQRGVDVGVDAFLSRPFDGNKFIAQVRALLNV